MEFLTNVLGFVIGISVLVFLHELGHFLMAKWCGVRVEQFSIGFPPKIFSKTVGDTEYTIGALPIGGFVKMAGMLDESMDSSRTGASDEFAEKNTFQKSIILLGGVLFNLLTAVLIFFYFNVRDGEIRVLSTDVQTIPHHSALKKYIPEDNIKLLSIAGTNVESIKEFFNIYLNHLGESIEIKYQLDDGSVQQTVLPENLPIDQSIEFPVEFAVESQIRIDSISPGTIAHTLGLLKKDILLRIGEFQIQSFNGLKGALHLNADQETDIVVLRGTDTLMYKATLLADKKGDVRLGFFPGFTTDLRAWSEGKISRKSYTLSDAFLKGANDTYTYFILNIKGIQMMIRGDIDPQKSISGPIAIAQLLGSSIGSLDVFLRMIALFSIMLAFMNLLPIPALDGGHLMIVLIEGIRGRELETETKVRIQKVGVFIVLSIMIFAITNDISKLF